MQLKFEWRAKTSKYAVGSRCYLGPYCVGETGQPTQTKDYVGPRWAPVTNMPDQRVAAHAALQETEAAAMTVVESLVTRWLERAGVAGAAPGV